MTFLEAYGATLEIDDAKTKRVEILCYEEVYGSLMVSGWLDTVWNFPAVIEIARRAYAQYVEAQCIEAQDA
jgi:hypothetical protein